MKITNTNTNTRTNTRTNTSEKQRAAEKALQYIKPDMTLGIGTGSTVAYFIEGLTQYKHLIHEVVSSSEASTLALKKIGLHPVDLNSVQPIDLYVDGADECDPQHNLIKGGGAALTREKIIAATSKQFICIINESKYVDILGTFPLPVEVIPMARSYVAKQLIQLGGQPLYREGIITDNGNVILDVHNLTIRDPKTLETQINQITGVVTNGLFAHRRPDIVLTGTD